MLTNTLYFIRKTRPGDIHTKPMFGTQTNGHANLAVPLNAVRFNTLLMLVRSDWQKFRDSDKITFGFDQGISKPEMKKGTTVQPIVV